MVGLYPGVDSYTDQLRALEGYARANPNSTSARFLLGYHYMVQGNQEAAAEQFENVVKLQPNETLSASFAKALRKAIEPAPVATAAATPAARPPRRRHRRWRRQRRTRRRHRRLVLPAGRWRRPKRPSSSLRRLRLHRWRAPGRRSLRRTSSITLTLEPDGKFAWDVDSKGQKQSLTGNAGFKDNELALFQQEGPPLIGKVTQSDANNSCSHPKARATSAGIDIHEVTLVGGEVEIALVFGGDWC